MHLHGCGTLPRALRCVALLVGVSPLFLALLFAGSSAGQQAKVIAYPDPDVGEDTLEGRATEQLAAATSLVAMHDFQFSDHLPESGITFVHRAVEDAARTYQAAHYDHGNGLGVADVDGDGLLDLYFVNQIGANELWRNLGGGRFENFTEPAGVGLADRVSVGASFADIDNDGDADLFVTSVRGGNALLENDGGGHFLDISAAAGVDYVGHSSGAVFLDYDGDGALDLFVTNVGTYTNDDQGVGGFYRALEDAFDGHLYPDRFETSILYRNLGANRFRDVSAELELLDESWSGDASIVDFNGDRFPDLYVLNMQGNDHYYENDAGRAFVEQTASLFPKTPWGAMGIKAFDYDNDGDFDLLLTDMHSDMNSDVAPADEDAKQPFQDKYFYQDAFTNILGNALYRNDGDGAFGEVSDALGLENYWPWGTSVADLNADGWQDVFITSSMNYPFRYQVNAVRLNERGEHFAPAEFIVGVEPRRAGAVRAAAFDLDCDAADADNLHCEGQSGALTVLGALGTRTSAIIDIDADGDLDIVTGEFNSAPQVLISDLGARRVIHWLAVRLEGSASNRDGLGAKVVVHAGTRSFSRFHDGKSGYLSQSAVPLYIGLGTAVAVDRVEVLWPSGIRQVLDGPIESNQLLHIREQ